MANRTPKRQLQDDIQYLTDTVEEMLEATADDTSSNFKELRKAAKKRLVETRARLKDRGEDLEDLGEDMYKNARNSVTHQADVFDKYAHNNPWKSIGLGAVVGVIVGVLLGRR